MFAKAFLFKWTVFFQFFFGPFLSSFCESGVLLVSFLSASPWNFVSLAVNCVCLWLAQLLYSLHINYSPNCPAWWQLFYTIKNCSYYHWHSRVWVDTFFLCAHCFLSILLCIKSHLITLHAMRQTTQQQKIAMIHTENWLMLVWWVWWYLQWQALLQQ